MLFIDEFDGVGKQRSMAGGGNDESVHTINQLLTEMDGFEDNTGVVVMAATNRPAALDTALTRPGRFDRILQLPMPNLEVHTPAPILSQPPQNPGSGEKTRKLHASSSWALSILVVGTATHTSPRGHLYCQVSLPGNTVSECTLACGLVTDCNPQSGVGTTSHACGRVGWASSRCTRAARRSSRTWTSTKSPAPLRASLAPSS